MIYCIEDDSGIRDLIVYTLSSAGFEAKGFAKPSDFWQAISHSIPDLILLDIMLPEEDGIDILKKLRSEMLTSSIPVIMATAKGTEYDKVVGLDLGADDYLVKPFGMMEMLSRVKAVLRRISPGKSDNIKIGDIEIDKLKHRVFSSGTNVYLTLKEYALLLLFAENPGIVFTREQLLDRIWGIDFIGETRTVDVHIGTLRTKLGKSGERIETIRGVGYRME